MKHALSEAALPRGFRFAATACGLKKTGALDLAIFTSEVPASAAAVFTQNLVVAPPVLVSKSNLRVSKGRMRGVVINAGNANCATGEEGRAAAQRTASEAAKHVTCKPHELFVCSTGVIGVPLAVDKILRRLPQLARQQRPSARSFAELSLAICTTDTRPKTASASFKMAGKRVHMVGCAKGAGMIHPNMATTLAFVATDANIAPGLLQKMLRDVTTRTFNSITIDGDTSTNDTLLILANGQAGAPAIQTGTKAHREFAAALEDICHSLALQIVADGEGAQRVIEIEVRGAKTEGAAKQIAQTIATSPLVKTAFAGGDPNWGRVFAAAGRSGVKFDPHRTDITMAGIHVLSRGKPLDFNERAASNRLLAPHVHIVMDLHEGRAVARYWTCDFTAEYVRINASYRT
jgi:glutamate N-acetyltransferase/amino-acid N-acetyltransferase